MALQKGLAALADRVEHIRECAVSAQELLLAAAAGAEIAEELRGIGEETQAQAAIAVAFATSRSTSAPAAGPPTAAQRHIVKLTLQIMEAEKKARRAERALATANASLEIAQQQSCAHAAFIAELQDSLENARGLPRCAGATAVALPRSPTCSPPSKREGEQQAEEEDIDGQGQSKKRPREELDGDGEGEDAQEDSADELTGPELLKYAKARGSRGIRKPRRRPPRSTGADLPRDRFAASDHAAASDPMAASADPRYWPESRDRTGRRHPPGYKLHVRDLPRNITRTQLATWMAKRCRAPIETNDTLAPSPLGRKQIVLTFDRLQDAKDAKRNLHDSDLEPGAHPTQTRWWRDDI